MKSLTEVYVAAVPLKYEVMAVAETADEAIRIACRKALSELRRNQAVYPETNTSKKIAEYFGVYAQRVPMGRAVIVGVDE